MDEHSEVIYLRMIERELETCLFTLERLEAFIMSLNTTEPRNYSFVAQRKFFRDIQTLAHHAAAVSRYFWPSPLGRNKKRAAERGKRLTFLFGINEDHYLSNRNLRDYFEHFDERIDHWAENSKLKHIVYDCIGRKDAYSGPEDTDFLGVYDPERHEYYFQGETYNIQLLATALHDIKRRLEEVKLLYPRDFHR